MRLATMMLMAVKAVVMMSDIIYDDDEKGNGRDSDHDGEVAGKQIDVMNALKMMGMAVRTSTAIITTMMTVARQAATSEFWVPI